MTCQVLAELNKIWSYLIFIRLYVAQKPVNQFRPVTVESQDLSHLIYKKQPDF